ncbi:MAG: tetratricopeptide repeat protein [Polyangiaceae bacterium]|nr:tetratricopeptide repeat protein [Polyangiaceae bacterium]
MTRFAVAGVLLASLGHAPLQCSRDPGPELRTEDTAGDALYKLAQNFRAKGNDAAARETLRFLVERYPSNRFAPAARDELEDAGVPSSK